MDKISIENIVRRGRCFFVSEGIKHPFVYPDGCVDLSAFNAIRLKGVDELSAKRKVFNYLRNPGAYTKCKSILNPEYLEKSRQQEFNL